MFDHVFQCFKGQVIKGLCPLDGMEMMEDKAFDCNDMPWAKVIQRHVEGGYCIIQTKIFNQIYEG